MKAAGLYAHVRLAAIADIWPLSREQSQRGLVAVESGVSVRAGFVWRGVTQLFDVCFLLGNNPSA